MVDDSVYEAAVRGRQQFRQAYREARSARGGEAKVGDIQGLIERAARAIADESHELQVRTWHRAYALAALRAALDPESDAAVDLIAHASYKAGGDEPGYIGSFRKGLDSDCEETRKHCQGILDAAKDELTIIAKSLAQGEQ